MPNSVLVSMSSEFPLRAFGTPWAAADFHAKFLPNYRCVKIGLSLENPDGGSTSYIQLLANINLHIKLDLKYVRMQYKKGRLMVLIWMLVYQLHNLVVKATAPVVKVVIEDWRYPWMREDIRVALNYIVKLDVKITNTNMPNVCAKEFVTGSPWAGPHCSTQKASCERQIRYITVL